LFMLWPLSIVHTPYTLHRGQVDYAVIMGGGGGWFESYDKLLRTLIVGPRRH
jgi:hypothetical protein